MRLLCALLLLILTLLGCITLFPSTIVVLVLARPPSHALHRAQPQPQRQPQPQPHHQHLKHTEHEQGQGPPPHGNGGVPNGWVWGCSNISASFPFCNTRLSIDDRVNDLINRLTQTELMSFMGASNATHVDNCNCMDNGIARLGIPSYMNLVEINTAVASACISAGQCATEFPCPTNLAATFNRSLWTAKGEVISTEMRAFNNFGWHRGMEKPYAKIGLNGYGPNINIIRDPRFGRNGELPSEDPFLTGSYAVHYLRGMQEGDDPRYQKILAGVKHFALYTVEANREGFIPSVSVFDLYDTYLPQYKMALTSTSQGGAQASAIMCSYAGLNQVPSCANDELLNTLVREQWKRDDVLIVTDCGALENMIDYNHYAKDGLSAASLSLNAGSDVDLGDNLYPPVSQGGTGALVAALESNLTDITHVIASVRRILTPRFRMGLFDPLELQEYTTIGIEQINATAHHELVLDAALQSLVLLKNQAQTLPFSRTKSIAVLGPHSLSQGDLFDDYRGDEVCLDGGFACVRTIAEVFTTTQLQQRLGHVYTAKGVDMDSQNATGIPEALQAAQNADQIVLCLGIGNQQEHEGIDRDDITLPGLQESFAAKILALGKPTVIVLINAGGVAIDNLLPNAPAVIEAFYPAFRGAEALYSAIFGLSNRWGKLPVTLYRSSFVHEQEMTNFNMTAKPGRTYRYYTNTPMFPFGFGLSYTTFSYTFNVSAVIHPAYSNSDSDSDSDSHFPGFGLSADPITVSSRAIDAPPPSPSHEGNYIILNLASPMVLMLHVDVTNTGLLSGDEILLVYHRVGTSISRNVTHPVPLRSLCEFTRLHLEPFASSIVSFTIQTEQLAITGHDGNKIVYPGLHQLIVTDGVQKEQIIDIYVQ